MNPISHSNGASTPRSDLLWSLNTAGGRSPGSVVWIIRVVNLEESGAYQTGASLYHAADGPGRLAAVAGRPLADGWQVAGSGWQTAGSGRQPAGSLPVKRD